MKKTSQTQLQKKIHQKKINLQGTTFFGTTIAPFLVRSYKKYFKFPYLDAGAGEGAFIDQVTKHFPKQKQQIFGFDLVDVPSKNIITADIKKLPYKDSQFSTITCTEVLEHLDENTLTKGLQELFRVLRPGGHLICTFPFDEDIPSRQITCPNCEHTFHPFGHVQSWHTPSQITSMFTKHKFQLVKLEIFPLGAVATIPMLKLLTPVTNKLPNLPGLRKRALVILTPQK